MKAKNELKLDSFAKIFFFIYYPVIPADSITAQRNLQMNGMSSKRVVESLDDLVGNTPLLHARIFSGEINCAIYLKLESCNPGGSVKDRTALALIRYGERHGLLKPGGVIVEPTSGNTGVGLALAAANRGYKCIFTVRDKVSREKIALLRAYGAEVIVCPSNVSPQHPNSYYSMARHIASRITGAYCPDQYENCANRQIHYETTGPEIWEQTNGEISHFVAGAGTGGTISGAGKYLKDQNPEVKIVCVDPAGSIFSSPEPQPYLIEGVGSDFMPANFVENTIDAIEVVSDSEAITMCHRLVRELGLLAGGSGGMVIAGALRIARTARKTAVIVALVPDSGRGYVSKIYSEAWLAEYGFFAGKSTSARWNDERAYDSSQIDTIRRSAWQRSGAVHRASA